MVRQKKILKEKFKELKLKIKHFLETLNFRHFVARRSRKVFRGPIRLFDRAQHSGQMDQRELRRPSSPRHRRRLHHFRADRRHDFVLARRRA